MRDKAKTIALAMASEHGLINLSRNDLCDRMEIPTGSFTALVGCTFKEFIDEIKKDVPDNIIRPVFKLRADPQLRRDVLLSVAVGLAIKVGYHKITRDQIATKAMVSTGLVSHYFGTMVQLRRLIVRHAVKNDIPEIIAQAIGQGDPRAKKASDDCRARALKILANW